jgi:uncharacterized protein
MNIKEFVDDLQNVYQQMSDAFATFQKSTKLNCLSGCGRCCLNPEIEATALEMLPFAWKIYKEGKLDEWIEKIESSQSSTCLLYLPGQSEGQGSCGEYSVRPSVCRMFGVSGYLGKNRELKLSVCKFIKQENPGASERLEKEFTKDEAPILSHWSSKLTTLHPFLIQERMPINQAALTALKKVALYAQLQERQSNDDCHSSQTP